MTIKVQCGCGAKYSFDVEPRNGVVPVPVNCPVCGADGAGAANAAIAQAAAAEPAAPRLRASGVPAAPAGEPAPLPPPVALPDPVAARAASLQRIKDEAGKTRRTLIIALAVVLLLVLIGAAQLWYYAVGSKPQLAKAMGLPESESAWRVEFIAPGKLLLACGEKAELREAATGRVLWTAKLDENAPPGGSEPPVYLDTNSIWICGAHQLTRLDAATGAALLTVPFEGELASFNPGATGILVVSVESETRRQATRVELPGGEISRREIEVPRAALHAMPDELPPGVQPTAGVLLAQATEENKFNKPITAVSSQFFSAGSNLVELRVRLVEPKVTWVKAIKPKGPSLINGSTTAGANTAAIAEEVFNDIKRDRTGGMKAIDESRYETRLRRWTGAAQPVEWRDEVNGVPSFYSLATVDLVTAGKQLIVFDKENTKLFESALAYPVDERFSNEAGDGPAPAAERDGMLYFFDQGVLTAFALPGGQVKWRLTSVGISRAQFDEKGMLYVDSTAAGTDAIQYTEQINFESTPPVILKVDPRSGKILWQAQGLGSHSYLTGKYVYASTSERGGLAMAAGLAEALNAPRPGGKDFYHLYLLDPETGEPKWKFYREAQPAAETFQQNTFALQFGNRVQYWRFLDF